MSNEHEEIATKKPLSELLDSLDAQWAEHDKRAEEERIKEEALLGPRIDLDAELACVPNDVMRRAWIREKYDRRLRAAEALRQGAPEEEVHNILQHGKARPVTTCDTDNRTQIQAARSDLERKHLRHELVKAHARAVKKGNPSLVHQPWLTDIQSLYDYAGPMPNDGMTKYRFCTIDTSKPFAPGNVKWQCHDDLLLRLRIRTVEFEGEQITLAELAKRTGLSVGTIRARYDAGVTGPDLWSGRNLGATHVVDIEGTSLTIAEAAAMSGINVNTLRARINKGLKGKDLFAKNDRRTGSAKKPVKALRGK